MDLGKIGDQNVEVFKGRPSVFCATKSVQPFKSYDRSKIGKGEKKHKNVKNLTFIHINMSLSQFFVFFPSSCLSFWVGCSPVSLLSLIWAIYGLKRAKNGQNPEMTTFFKAYSCHACVNLLINPNLASTKGKMKQRKFIKGFTGPEQGKKWSKLAKLRKTG